MAAQLDKPIPEHCKCNTCAWLGEPVKPEHAAYYAVCTWRPKEGIPTNAFQLEAAMYLYPTVHEPRRWITKQCIAQPRLLNPCPAWKEREQA